MKSRIKRRSIMNFTGFSLILLAAVFIALSIIVRMEAIQKWYAEYDELLMKFETAVESIGYAGAILLIIFGIYVIKCFVPIISLSGMCLITGMLFPIFTAMLINVSGLIIMLVIKYDIGIKLGGGNPQKLMKKNEAVRTLIEHEGSGNPWLLLAFRLVPSFPINSISQLYGSMNFGRKRFIIISLIGYAPKLISYTFIGRSVYDPLSSKFFIPMISLLMISGVSVLALNALLNVFEKNDNKQNTKR